MAEVRGLAIVRLHYSADPAKADPAWAARQKVGYPAHKWEREMEMNAHAGARLAVFAMAYRPEVHERPLTADRELIMRNGWDFGAGFPARVWAQRTRTNAVHVLASRVGAGVQLRSFAEQTIGWELTLFDDLFDRRVDYCDPAGNQSKDDGLKSVEVLRSFGWTPRWRGSRVDEGIQELDDLMHRHDDDGAPMFLIDPRHNPELCLALRANYKRDATGAIVREHPWVDVVDALRYLVVNTRTAPRARVAPTPIHFNEVSGYGRAPMPGAVLSYR